MWDPPRSGIEPMSPALEGRFFTTEPTGKPWTCSLERMRLLWPPLPGKATQLLFSASPKVLSLRCNSLSGYRGLIRLQGCGASLNRDGGLRVPPRLHRPPRRVVRITFLGSRRPATRRGLAGCGLCRGLVSLGNLLSLSESLSHLQFWGLQLLPYVGCLCLHDPSHINVIIRASIYTGFLLSSNSSCLRDRFTSSSLHGWFRDIIPFYVRGQIGRKRRGGGRNVAETEKEKGPMHPTSSPMRLMEGDQEHHADLSAPAVLVCLP